MEIKSLLKKIAILGIVIVLLLGFWFHCTTQATHLFNIKKVSYSSELIPEGFNGFKVGFISDFELKTSEDIDYLEKCIAKLNKQNCHMVIFGGDIFSDGVIFEEERMISALKSIKAPYGKFAVLGEKEFLSSLEGNINLLETSGFEVLRNQSHNIYYKNQNITLSGLENSSDLSSIISSSQENNFNLVVVHQPDYFSELKLTSMDVQLSGHSGGGYVYIPFVGAINQITGASSYIHGHYEENGKDLYVSNGVGMQKNQEARVNCYPNAIVLTLVNPNASEVADNQFSDYVPNSNSPFAPEHDPSLDKPTNPVINPNHNVNSENQNEEESEDEENEDEDEDEDDEYDEDSEDDGDYDDGDYDDEDYDEDYDDDDYDEDDDEDDYDDDDYDEDDDDYDEDE